MDPVRGGFFETEFLVETACRCVRGRDLDPGDSRRVEQREERCGRKAASARVGGDVEVDDVVLAGKAFEQDESHRLVVVHHDVGRYTRTCRGVSVNLLVDHDVGHAFGEARPDERVGERGVRVRRRPDQLRDGKMPSRAMM